MGWYMWRNLASWTQHKYKSCIELWCRKQNSVEVTRCDVKMHARHNYLRLKLISSHYERESFDV